MSKKKTKGFDASDPVLREVLRKVLQEMRALSGCQCVGIRLQKDGDYPYYVYESFPEFFILKENSLCERDSEGSVVLDDDGTPFLACMCGNVLKRRCNPKFHFFTKEGCFWTNSTTQLLATPVEEERRLLSKIRGMCYESGYESVALIPMQVDDRVLGLIQLNDPRENMFTLDKIGKYKLIADQVGVIVLNALEISGRMSRIHDMIRRFKTCGE